MNYDFSFSGKTLSLVLAGSAFVGIMLFIAGLLVGTNWIGEPNTAAPVAVKQTVAEPMPEPTAAPPVAPIMSADLSTPHLAATVPADAASVDAATASPDRQAHGSVPGVNSSAASVNRRREQAPASAAPNDTELRVIQEAEPAAATEPPESPTFSVQVGVFATENDAHQLARQLQKKGHAAVILAARGDRAATWFAVRIGTYTNKTEAAQAAAKIAGQEKIEAIVRPFGSL